VTQSNALTPRLLIIGCIAGVIGGILLDAYFICFSFATTHAANIAAHYQAVAVGALGKGALTDPGAAWFGFAIHYGVSIAWGIAYVYAATQSPALASRPIVSGIFFGIVVYLMVQLLAIVANTFYLGDIDENLNGFVAYTLFFGIPVALATRFSRTA
jgi:hypothetical protein